MKRKKSKARQEYERLRRNLLQARSRAEKRGSKYWFDLPATPLEEARASGKKSATAKEYKKATTGLKAMRKFFEGKWKREQEAQTATPPDASEAAIEQWIKQNFEPMNEDKTGAEYIIGKVWEYVARYGAKDVAQAINDMKADGYLIGKAEVYRVGYAMKFMANMQSYLLGKRLMNVDEMFQAEDALFDLYGEDVEEELQ